MTASTSPKPKWIIAVGMPLLIFLGCFLVTLTTQFKANKDLFSDAILIDLLLVAPLIYFLAIRKTKIPAITVSRIFLVGLLVAGFILSAPSNNLLHLIETWVSPVVEGVVICFVGYKLYLANKKAKAANSNKPDFLMHCRAVMFQLTGHEKFANIISSEIAVLYYAVFGGRYKAIDNETKFSSYHENGITIVLWAILSIFLIETAGMHFLLTLWSNTVAWVITGLSFYTCIQLFAHIRAVKARPIFINNNSLEIHNGLAGDAFITFDNIEKFELSKKVPSGRNPVKIALLNGLENHNVVVYLKTPMQVTKIFGIKKDTDTVMFYVDKSKDFSNALSARLLVHGA